MSAHSFTHPISFSFSSSVHSPQTRWIEPASDLPGELQARVEGSRTKTQNLSWTEPAMKMNKNRVVQFDISTSKGQLFQINRDHFHTHLNLFCMLDVPTWEPDSLSGSAMATDSITGQGNLNFKRGMSPKTHPNLGEHNNIMMIIKVEKRTQTEWKALGTCGMINNAQLWWHPLCQKPIVCYNINSHTHSYAKFFS